MYLGMNDALLLIALGMGYVVLYLAKREEKRLQFYGYLIGVVIIILSTLFILSNVWLQATVYCARPRPFKKIMLRRVRPPMPQAPQTQPAPKR